MAAMRAAVSMCGRRALCLLLVAVLCAVNHVSAMEVYAPEEMFVENGTHATLSCTFKSTQVVSALTSVKWSFTAEGSGPSKAIIFYYASGKSYPAQEGPFKSRVTWAGDINKKDTSIRVDKINFKDNGTYTCEVLNPPDISGDTSKIIRLRVVEKENLPVSNVPFLVGIICAAIGGILLITIIVSAVVITKKKRSRKNYSGGR